MRTIWVCAMVTALLACGDDSSTNVGGGGTVDTSSSALCASYFGQCGDPEGKQASCEMTCAQGVDSIDDDGDCSFYACGATVAKCDNQEPGDPSILKCIYDNGWHDEHPCDRLTCEEDCQGASLPQCQNAMAAANAHACIDAVIACDASWDI